MAVHTRVAPIDRDIAVMLSDDLSPAARSKALAEFAREEIDGATEHARQATGKPPRTTVTVDGREGAALESVKPDGAIVAEFDLLTDTLAWMGEQLVLHSPVKTGRYQDSHILYADGVEVSRGEQIPPAQRYIFANSQPYSRKLERGSSSQAPNGVYEAVAALAARRFGNIARVRFTFASLHANVSDRQSRQPAIEVIT